MNYKHPYFDHQYFATIRPNRQLPGEVPMFPADPNRPAFITGFPAITDHSISGRYVPNVVDHMLSTPTWMQGDPCLCEVLAETFNPISPNNGYSVDIDSRIVHGGIFDGYINAQAVQVHEGKLIGYPTYVVNTNTAGFRQVTFDENGGCPMDNGPVEDMMLFGNEARPEGIYVPFCNAKAMADAACLINAELAHYESELVKTLNKEAKALIADPVESHECKCGGNCQCGGICNCGGNCKCHHE